MKLILLLPLVVSISGCVTYPLPDATLKPIEVCGTSKCNPGNVGILLQFKEKPFSPDVHESIDPIDIAFSVLGHTTKTRDKTGGIIQTCSFDNTNPFKKSDVVMLSRFGPRKIEYTRSATLNIDVVPTVSSTLTELSKQISISKYVDELEAKLKAGYKNINSSKATLTGLYYEYGLSQEVIKSLRTEKYANCNEYLTKNDRSLITALGLINFSTAIDGADYSNFLANLNATFKAHGADFDVSPIVNREITKTLKASSENGYQIIVWKKATPLFWKD